jgi:selenoprotein W-related protein
VPGSGGQFEVEVNGQRVFSKKAQGRYPEIAELKQAINAFLD